MPFTASHAAAVLPFRRWGLVPAALVIGSMAPDLLFYLPISSSSAVTHSLSAVIGVDLLIGLVAFVGWKALLAPAAYALSPAWLRTRVPLSAVDGLRRHLKPLGAVQVVLSLVTGSLTHVVWDAFTHGGGWGARAITALQRDYGPMPGYYWAQWISSAVGALVLVVVIVRWVRRTHPERRPEVLPPGVRVVVISVLIVLAIVGAALELFVWPSWPGTPDLMVYMFLALTGGLGAAGIGAVLFALGLQVWPAAWNRRTVDISEHHR